MNRTLLAAFLALTAAAITAKAADKPNIVFILADARNTVELFNLKDDLSESTNLAEKYPERVQELRTRLDAYAAQAVAPKSRPPAADFKSPKVWGEAE